MTLTMKIFNELEYAERMLADGFIGTRMGSNLLILAKYYFYFGKKYSEVWNDLSSFCAKFLNAYDEDLYAEKITYITKAASKLNLRIPVDVPITENEIESIKKIKNHRFEKVLFTMLVLAKYYKLTNSSKKKVTSKYYYVNNSFSEILNHAHTTQKENEIVHSLYVMGMIDRSKIIDSYIIKFTDGEDNSNVKIVITDMNNIIKFYPIYCISCGNEMEFRRKREMCDECFKKDLRDRINFHKRNYRKRLRGIG